MYIYSCSHVLNTQCNIYVAVGFLFKVMSRPEKKLKSNGLVSEEYISEVV
jgi:hypothetical protein